MAARKIIGITFSIIAVLSSVISITQSNLSFDFNAYFDFSLKSYFSLAYLRQITPLVICLILLYGGILLIIKPSKSNPVLALFGFIVLEEVIFNWLDIVPINFPTYIVVPFFSGALLAIWIAYSNTINLKRLSFQEGITSLILGTLINVFSYYF
jgi:hypothetical protein